MRYWYERYSDESHYLYFFKRVTDRDVVREITPALFHGSVEFAFCIEGEFNVWINEVTYTVHAGEIVFIRSLEPHAYYYKKGVTCYIVVISQSFFNEQNGLSFLAFPTLMPKDAHFEKVLQYLDYIWELWDDTSLSLKISFSEMLVYLMKKYYPARPVAPVDEKQDVLREVVKYICLHFNEDLKVESLARQFGYSPIYFSALFNRFMGMGFRDYLNAYRRIEYKKLRRGKTENPIVADALACGFNSMKTFYRAYGKYGFEKYE